MSNGIGIPGFEGADYSSLPKAFTMTTADSFFAPDAAYRNGEVVLLHLKGPVRNVTYDEPNPEPMTEGHVQYPVGKNEGSYDGGETIRRSSGQEKIDAKTSYFRFIQAMAGTGLLDEIHRRGGSARKASSWKGLDVDFERKEETYGVDREGKQIVSQRMMPVAARFLGAATAATPPPPTYVEGSVVNGYVLRGGAWVPVEQAPTPAPPPVPPVAPTQAPPPPPVAAAAPASNGVFGNLDAGTLAKLREIAVPTRGQPNGMYQFFDAAFKAFADDSVRAQIMQPALYDELVK